MALIEAKSLRKVYGSEGAETVAVEDVSLSVNAGEFVAIMGPSGSGKSTLLHILGFLDRYTSGTYVFDGKEMSEYSEDELAHIRNHKMGFIFQAFNLLARSTVLENVKLPLLYSDIPEAQWNDMAMKAIETVGLTHRMHHQSYQLSGGERQRVAIARALILSPQVIFADEPTGNLDSKSGQAVMRTIQRLNEEQGHTIILITHETHTAEHAERILTILDGRIDSNEKVAKRRHATDIFEK
ncbi:MAG: ABC transporter ATP-binding protein [Minisyncoccia bacterium]|jgi:putative ABC transport system ATP-binding protein